MQIRPSHNSSVINSALQVKKVEPPVQQQYSDTKDALRQATMKYISDFQAALNETGDDNPRVQQIMDKFKSGKKLTPEEMEYITREAPGKLEYINSIMRERELVEQSMRIAGSKFDVMLVVSQAAKNIEKLYSGEDVEVRMRHLQDAYSKYQKTDEYKEKPEIPNGAMAATIPLYKQKNMLLAYDTKTQKLIQQL